MAAETPFGSCALILQEVLSKLSHNIREGRGLQGAGPSAEAILWLLAVILWTSVSPWSLKKATPAGCCGNSKKKKKKVGRGVCEVF